MKITQFIGAVIGALMSFLVVSTSFAQSKVPPVPEDVRDVNIAGVKLGMTLKEAAAVLDAAGYVTAIQYQDKSGPNGPYKVIYQLQAHTKDFTKSIQLFFSPLAPSNATDIVNTVYFWQSQVASFDDHSTVTQAFLDSVSTDIEKRYGEPSNITGTTEYCPGAAKPLSYIYVATNDNHFSAVIGDHCHNAISINLSSQALASLAFQEFNEAAANATTTKQGAGLTPGF